MLARVVMVEVVRVALKAQAQMTSTEASLS
jgi:hypothetical protein